jgi:hypothetical protein
VARGSDGSMSIENRTDNVVFATAWKPYKPDAELHITLSTWCVSCYRSLHTYEPATFVFEGNSLCEKCCLNASADSQ